MKSNTSTAVIMQHMIWITAALCLCLATVVGFLQFSDNEVKESVGDRYELHPACMTLIRSQINMEMQASLVYMNMAAHFDQNSVARKGFAKMFRENSKEEREHAQKLIDYLNLRGNKLAQFNIDMPDKTTWANALEALKEAIALEKDVYNQLNHIHDVADTHCKDSHLTDYLEREFLEEQVESIDSFIRHSSVLGAMSDSSLGEYLYDQQLLRDIKE
ncbi:soma ferritin-like isoform X2 [Uloborus diversus]|uniref:soma ferritin-like isoform X2 n=1 Tax=Uloborus diversus TaxID=327109 RepID=UPI00240A0776|nr:soma ferritin-like isoform X2 [Uloborus diversus]